MARFFRLVTAIIFLMLVSVAVARAQGQQLRYVRGTVKSVSSDSIVLTNVREMANASAPVAEMTFAIGAGTRFVNRQMIAEMTTVMVGFAEQDGRRTANIITFMGFSNGVATPYNGGLRQPGQNPYNTPVPIPPNPGAPARSPGGPLPARPGGCQYSAGPCVANPEGGPQLLPANTPHDFHSVRQQAEALCREHPGAKVFNINLNYANGAVSSAEFDFVAESDGKRRNERWGLCRVRIDGVPGNMSQYQAVVDFTDQIDAPPPSAPANLVSPWEAMSSMIAPSSLRQQTTEIDLRQAGAMHRLMRNAGQDEYMELLDRSLNPGQWIWGTSGLFPTNPNTGTLWKVTYADAATGRGASECANRTGGNVATWTVVACPNASNEPRSSNPQPSGGGLFNPQGSQKVQCNEKGKNCRPVN